MKIFLTLVILLSFVRLTNAQRDSILYEVDYFTWNNLDDENIIYINQLNNGHKIIRHFFKNKINKIEWEIIKISGSEYLYLEYSDTAMTPIRSGLLKVSDDYIEDKITYFKPITFEEQHIYKRKKQLVKHRFWDEEDNFWWCRGYYKNGFRDGKWLMSCLNSTNEFDVEDWVYDNGKLLSKKILNKIMTENQDTIFHYLTQKWSLQSTMSSNPIQLVRNINDDLIKSTLVFFKNETFKYSSMTSIGLKESKGTWELNGNNLLELKFNNRAKSQIYSIEYLLDDYLQLRLKR